MGYEKKVQKALPQAQAGLWFEFRDATGTHYCQPDLILDLGRTIIVIECKLTHTWEAHSQLKYLYLPVVEDAFGRRTRGIVVCRHLTRDPPELAFASLAEALEMPRLPFPVVHWLGAVPALLAPQLAAA